MLAGLHKEAIVGSPAGVKVLVAQVGGPMPPPLCSPYAKLPRCHMCATRSPPEVVGGGGGSARLAPSPQRSGVVAAGSGPIHGRGVWGVRGAGGGGGGDERVGLPYPRHPGSLHWRRGSMCGGGLAVHATGVARRPCRRRAGGAPIGTGGTPPASLTAASLLAASLRRERTDEGGG